MFVTKGGVVQNINADTLPYWQGLGWVLDSDGNGIGDPVDAGRRLALRGALKAGVASRAQPSPSTLSTAGTNVQNEARLRHRATIAINGEVEVGYSNVYNNNGVETDGTDPITVRCAIEYPANVFHPLFSGAGSRDLVISPGATAFLRGVVSIPAGADFWTRSYTTVADNTKRFPIFGPAVPGNGEGATAGAAVTDHTTAAGISTGAGYATGPSIVRVTGIDPATLVLAGIGDSIMDGSGDSADVHLGWWGRAFEGQAAYQRIALPSEKAQNFADPASRRRRAGLIVGANVMVCSYGINDVNAARTLSQIQADLQACWAYGAALGMKVLQTTITPKTTSSDAWATVGNQTVTANESVRVALNDWIRTTPSGLTGYLELADAAETSRNSGKWVANGTADGTHPSTAVHTAMAAIASAALPSLRLAAA